MICPKCNANESDVIDSRRVYRRSGKHRDNILRRRACSSCGHKWSTSESAIKKASEIDYASMCKEELLEEFDLNCTIFDAIMLELRGRL